MLLGAFLDQGIYENILDIGTGTGVLALMAIQRNPGAIATGIDIDAETLKDCHLNFINSPWKNQLLCKEIAIENYSSDALHDCIICNPPYYENGHLSENASINNAKHTKDFSLKTLFDLAILLISKKGHFWIILPQNTSNKWCEYASTIGLQVRKKIELHSKKSQPIRTIYCFTLDQVLKVDTQLLVIRNLDNSYTQAYKDLTKDFHNKLL